jgi:RNA polymerase sigma-B factor
METANRAISGETPFVGLADEAALWKRRDEPNAREEIAERYMDFAKGIALSFRTGPESVDDLVQVASLALVKAIDRFDPERGIPFQAFASPTINGELKRHFRDRVSPVRVPRSLYERIAEVDSAVSELSADLKRGPSVNEIAEEMDTAEHEVIEAMEAKQSRYPVSMESPARSDPDDVAPAERIGTEDETFDEVEDNLTLQAAAGDLSETEKQVLRLRFREDMTQSEIAERIGYSQMHVSRILRRSIERLRRALGPEAI